MLDFLLLYGVENKPIPEESIRVFAGQSIGECDFVYRAAVHKLSEARDRFALFCVSNQPEPHLALDERGSALEFFDGTLIQGAVRSDIRTLEPISADHADIHGVYVHGRFSTNEVDHINRDLLGFYPLFVGISNTFYAVSNNPNLMAQALHPLDYKKRKNLMAPATLLFSISSWDAASSYEHVFYCPQNAGLRIDRANRLSYYCLCENFYAPTEPDEWRRLFDSAYEKALLWGALTGKQGADSLSEISGGYDSRVALAIAVKTGTHKSVTWQVRGSEDDPDVIIAKRIARQLNLKLDWSPPRHDAPPESPDDYYMGIRRFYHRVGGTDAIPLYGQVICGDSPISDIEPKLKFGGTAGEMFKAYFSKWWLKKGLPNQRIDSSVKELGVNSLLNDIPIRSMLKNEFLEFFTAVAEKRLSCFENLYDIDLLYNYTFISRFHGGNASRLYANGPMPVWLGNIPMLHKLTYAAPAEWHAANSMVFRLIEKSCPELLIHPFAGLIWQHPLAYYRRRDASEIYKLRGIMPPERMEVSGPEPAAAGHWLQTITQRYGTTVNEKVAALFQKEKLEKYLEPLPLFADGKIQCGQSHILGLLHFMGLSMFMDDLEMAPPANRSGPSAVPAEELIRERRKALHAPPPGVYQEPVGDVIKRGDLFFDREKKFHAANRQKLEGTEKLIVELLREIPAASKKA